MRLKDLRDCHADSHYHDKQYFHHPGRMRMVIIIIIITYVVSQNMNISLGVKIIILTLVRNIIPII